MLRDASLIFQIQQFHSSNLSKTTFLNELARFSIVLSMFNKRLEILTILCFSSEISVGASITKRLCLKKKMGTVPKFLRSFLRSSSFEPTKTLGSFFLPMKFLIQSSAGRIPPGCLHDSLITFFASVKVFPSVPLPSYSSSLITHFVMTRSGVSLIIL